MSYAASRPVTAEEVPIVDVGALRDGSGTAPVGERLAWAASSVGFLYVSNHGVPDAVVRRAREQALAFFRMPDAAKAAASTNEHHHGWLRPGATRMDDDQPVDLKESFNFGIEPGAQSPAARAANPLVGPNRWPPAMPALRAAAEPWFESASALAVDLLRGFALGAGLDADAFVGEARVPVSRGSFQYYPPQPPEAGTDRFGVGPHTDFGVLTVLGQDDVGGLQIRSLDGEWLAVPPVAGTLVVNVGDLLARWSNGRFHSTVHRVINASGRERLSLVLAWDPEFDALVDPRALCREGETPVAPPITCGDYLMERFHRAFAYRHRAG